MPAEQGYRHRKLPSDAVIHTRQPVNPETGDTEHESITFERRGLEQLKEVLGIIARRAENRSRVVDEYNSAAVTGAGSSAAVVVQPTYELMPEKIEAIIITGPAGAITLQLGDRIWQLVVPATGILVIAPIALILGRSDPRTLTPAVLGVYTLELMGVADQRFSA